MGDYRAVLGGVVVKGERELRLAGYAVMADKLVKEVRLKGGRRLRVLDEVSFKVPLEAKVAIVGPSGCGKTVLLKVISTIYIPDSGEVRVFGLDVVKQAGRVRRLLSFVSPSLDFHKKLTIDETLRFFSKVQGSNPEPAYQFLDFIKMGGLRERAIGGLSEGQKAAVRLAIGLMKRPKLLLLDEPTANLDVARKELVVEYLKKNVREATVMMVDHDPKVVTRLCDQVILMRTGGRVIKSCGIETLLNSFPFKYRFNIKVYSKSQLPKEALSKLGYPFQTVGNIVRFLLSSREEVKELIGKLISKRGLLSFEVSQVSMEDVYYWMTQHIKEAEEAKELKEASATSNASKGSS
ncbi:MAG: ABC transporter ATP-binding protein [Candidatus Nezhaarchaeota archaeon]|nr:ABC transporter ATP-binding protein [Candidatus Nezhaarchaeota archaeon]